MTLLYQYFCIIDISRYLLHDFHEDCINTIMLDLIKLMQPRYIEVLGKFTPRGGISIDPYCNYGIPNTKYEELAWYRLMNHNMHYEDIDNR